MIDKEPKEASKRSPNFPGIALEEALGNIRTIYDKDKLASTSALVILGHLGYDKLHGRSRRVIAALRQYGLLEEVGNQRFKISDKAFKLLHLELESAEALFILREIALSPPAFGSLINAYKGDMPSDAALTSELVLEKGFTPDGASQFLKVLRSNIAFAKIDTEVLTGSRAAEPSGRQVDGNDDPGNAGASGFDFQSVFSNMFSESTNAPEKQESLQTASSNLVKPLFRYSVPLSINRKVNAELLITGTSLSKRDMEVFARKVKDLLDAFEDEEISEDI